MQHKETILIKNMICNSCMYVIRNEFQNSGIRILNMSLGKVEIEFNPSECNMEKVEEILNKNGFEIILDREQRLVEQIKLAVIELIHYLNNVDSIVRKSDYLVEKLGMSYQQLSKAFSKYESITLEKYIILHKIERIKELIDGDDFTLSEIAYMMDYSSVQYLSNQFKSITGITVSEYKKSDKSIKRSLNEIR